jgi:hypothetical protein
VFVSRDVVFVENFNENKIEKQTTSYIIQNEKSKMSMDFHLSKDEDGGKRKTFYTKVEEPLSLKEVIKGENMKEWKKAINLEYNDLMDKVTWRLVKLPKGRKALGCK